ncbi:protein timeless homolog [Trichonephila clavata]|uniref:Protein timeless homolog n=1 Tax=Trichonephila clavata TaxID=2740835 RepID=A0A8X6F098_TRICU|nr:protein timeless homolog [Trichonephila clavata]
MDKFTEAEILGTCNALGSEVRGVYQKGTDCLECLRDLLQYLRRPDENHSVLRFLGANHLIETDLIPILKRYKDEKEIFDFALRLLVALTSPAILLFNEEIPVDKTSHNVYLELNNHLQNYKKAFFEIDIWKVLYEHLEKRISLRPIERSEEDNLFIERILIVIRNILHIPSDELSLIQTDDNLSPQDRILWNLHLSKIDIIILYLCANEDEYKYCLHIIEILSLMFQEHSSETLATTNAIRSGEEKGKDLQTLMMVREREQNMKYKKIQSMISSRFNGVYRVKNMKSLSDKDYISHKLITNLDDVNFDAQKNAKRKPKNRLPLKDMDMTRRSTLNIRLFLKNFCKEFLQTYNKLMATVKRELLRKTSGDHDDSYHLWAVEYFMKFNRLYSFQPALVSETISLQMFHHIHTQITNYHEMMLTDKSKAKIWSKRMQLGVSAYKELLETVFTMTKSADINIQQNADVIISSVFYVIEYREMLLSLLFHYDEVKFSLTYLSKLVESAYMFLKMLENHSKRHSDIIVQKRKKKTKRRKKKTAVTEQSKNEDLEVKWDSISGSLSAAVQGRRIIPTDSSPFDGASELTFEEQKVDAVYKIREALLTEEVEQAVSLLRCARELWPEGNSFGAADIDSEDEYDVLREIYLSNLENPHPQNSNIEAEPEETDEEAESMPAVIEQKLDMNDIYKKYASPKVVMPCCLLLANYQSNSLRTNACLIKLLHKIAWDYKMHALFFQSTVFLTFQKIFDDPDVSCNAVIKEFYRFAKFIVSKFFEVAEKNNKAFIELLFWKGHREAYELVEGYGTSHTSNVRGAWTEDEEEELKYLYEENKDIYIEGQDVADIIHANINQKKRTKHEIILALKRLGLIQNAKDLKPHLRKEWREDEINELQHLFEDFKTSDDVMGNILSKLSIKRSRKAVIEKMLELNLIQDRKEISKKRAKKSKKNNRSDSDSPDENSDLEDEILSGQNQSTHRNHNEDSSDNDDEENFFRNLKAELLDSNDVSNLKDENSLAEAKEHSENQVQKKSKSSKVWDEQEIMELRDLFIENQGENDIMSIILNSLTIKRSKQSVIEKLLEVGLIKDKKELKKKYHHKLFTENSKLLNGDNQPKTHLIMEDEALGEENVSLKNVKKKNKKIQRILSDSSEDEMQINNAKNDKNLQINEKVNSKTKDIVKTKKENDISNKPKVGKRAPKAWEEQEIIELHQLFEKHRNSSDIIGNIIIDQSVKRPKERIIEKLLEVGLIIDRKEIRKKRKKEDYSNKKEKKNINSNKKLLKVCKSKKISNEDSSTSGDETLPLSSLKRNGQKENHNGEIIDKKAANLTLSESSDNDLNICFRDRKIDNSGSEKKINETLSDSSNAENISLHNSISNHYFAKSMNLKDKDPIQNYDKYPLSENQDDKQSTNLFSIAEKEKKPQNAHEGLPSHKRKRCQIYDSDSEGESTSLEYNSRSSKQLLQDVNETVNLDIDINSDPDEENEQLPKIKKKARILIESDDSD